MTSDPLSEAVRRLLREHLTSFEQLEALLYLQKHSDRTHSAESLSEALGIRPVHLTEALRALAASGFVFAAEVDGTYRFAPRSPALLEAVEGLTIAYREHSAAVLSTMSINAIERIRSGPLRAFADSFVVGKRKGDG